MGQKQGRFWDRSKKGLQVPAAWRNLRGSHSMLERHESGTMASIPSLRMANSIVPLPEPGGHLSLCTGLSIDGLHEGG